MSKNKDSKQSIHVTIRVRPLSEKEQFEDSRTCVQIEEESRSINMLNGNDSKKFTFDSICDHHSQEDIFEKVGKPSTIDSMEGYNCTIFAYGQTGAGKTFTMMGVNDENQQSWQLRGLIPRTLQYLFSCIDENIKETGSQYLIKCSFLEIYNEQIIDLLNKNNNNMQIREDIKRGVYVEGLCEQSINQSQEAMEILYKGSKGRHVGSTCYNEASSRSHSVFTMQISSKCMKNGITHTKTRQFHFIDLAGSERTKQSIGQRLKQGCSINKSLHVLGKVINSLAESSEGKSRHINYRDSKLTFLLKDSLGGNSKTHLIANISPSSNSYHQSISTLSFARRVKLIKINKVIINEDSAGNLESLKNQIKRLNTEIISLRKGSIPMLRGQNTNDTNLVNIMQQYVSEEIQKQTKYELQVNKLNNCIRHLQKGIQEYSSNEIHLRMIISVYQDKIERLKEVEEIVQKKAEQLTVQQNKDKTDEIMSYIKNERKDMITEIAALKNINQSSPLVKTLLKQLKMLEDGDNNKINMKEMFQNNNQFLNSIFNQLQNIKPITSTSQELQKQFQKQISILQAQNCTKQAEMVQKIEEMGIEIAEYKKNTQENEVMLKQSVSCQIGLEDKIQEQEKIIKQARISIKEKQEIIEVQKKQFLVSNQQKEGYINQIIEELNHHKQIQGQMTQMIQDLKKRIQEIQKQYKDSLEGLQQAKSEKNNRAKLLQQKQQQLQQTKNIVRKLQLQFQNSHEKYELCQRQYQERIRLMQSQMQNKKEIYKQNEKKIRQEYQVQISNQVQKYRMLKIECTERENLNSSLRNTTQNLQKQLFLRSATIEKLEKECQESIKLHRHKQKELLGLINKKQENNSQAGSKINELQVELLNMNEKIEQMVAVHKKQVGICEERTSKQLQNQEILEQQVNKIKNNYSQLEEKLQVKKNQCNEINNNVGKMKRKLEEIKMEKEVVELKLVKINQETDQQREKYKKLQIELLETRNQLYAANKNHEIELESLRNQNNGKNQQLEKIQIQLMKVKNSNTNNLCLLQKQLKNETEMLKNDCESIKKSMQMHLNQKEKKLVFIRNQLEGQKDMVKKLGKDGEIYKKEMEAQLEGMKEQYEEKSNRLIEAQNEIKLQLQERTKLENIVYEMETEISEHIDGKNQLKQQYQIERQIMEKRLSQQELVIKQIERIKQGMKNEIQFINDSLQNSEEITKKQEQCIISEKQLNKKFVKELQSNNVLIQELKDELHKAYQLKNKTKLQLDQRQKELSVIETYKKEIEQLKLKVSQDEVENERVCDELSIMISQKQKYEVLYAELQSTVTTKQNESMVIEESKRKIIALEKLNNQQEEKIKKFEEEQLKHGKIMQCLKSENDILLKQCEKLRVDVSSSYSQIEQITQNFVIADKKNKQYQHKISDNGVKQEQKISLLCKLEEELLQRDQQLEEKRKILEDFKVQKEALTNYLQQMQKQKDEKISEVTKLLAKSQEENSIVLNQLNSLDTKYHEVVQKIQLNTCNFQNISKKNDQISELESKLKQSNEMKENMEKQLLKEKDIVHKMRLLAENLEEQRCMLERERQQIQNSYKKLLVQVAKNGSQYKKNQENDNHHQNTVYLLEKSRKEQLQLRKYSEDLNIINRRLKEQLDEKEKAKVDIQNKSEQYCKFMKVQCESIKNDHLQVERSHKSVLKEKKDMQRENERIKDEMISWRKMESKLLQKVSQLQQKNTQLSEQYIKLTKQLQKSTQMRQEVHDRASTLERDKMLLRINQLKSQVNTLRVQNGIMKQKVMVRSKYEKRYGRESEDFQTQHRIDMEKKSQEIKYLQDILHEICGALHITKLGQKSKLQTIRSVIISTIKEKMRQLGQLKYKNGQFSTQIQEVKYYKPDIMDSKQQSKMLQNFNYQKTNTKGLENTQIKPDRDANDIPCLNNKIRSKLSKLQSAYTNLRQVGDDTGKPPLKTKEQNYLF